MRFIKTGMPCIKPDMTKQRRGKAPPAGEASPHEGERIAKVMARAGLCSRREAESWIAEGRVSVNGAVISSPALNVTAGDKISVDGKPLPQRERTRLFLYHKPRGLVTTHADPEKRPTIFETLPEGLPRLISVGRLDLNTEGLLLLTNDGGLARILELPETGWLRRYRVRALGSVTQPQLDALRRGITIDGIRYGEIEATLDRQQGANVWLTFAIREGKNREVRKVLEHLGLKVNRLIRVSYGPFQLGDLPDGAVEEVRTRHLREQLGERIAGKAGADFQGPMSAFDATRQEEFRRPPRPGRAEQRDEKIPEPHKQEREIRSARSQAGATPRNNREERKPRPDPRREKAFGKPRGPKSTGKPKRRAPSRYKGKRDR